MSRRKIAPSNIWDVDHEAYDSVSDYLGGLVAFAQEIEATLEQDMLLIPQPVPAASHSAMHEISPDRRSAQRTLTIYRLVQIDSGGDRGFARCRNISDSGVRLDLSMPLEIGAAVEIAFSPSNVLPGRVVWKVDHSCGIAFDAKVDSAHVLTRSAAELHGDRARPFRLSANLPARVSSDGRTRATTVLDISQRGVKLTHDGSFHRGMSIRVVLASGAEREGVVQWVEDHTAGVYFIEPFSVDELGSIKAL